jgi:choline-sulfatase
MAGELLDELDRSGLAENTYVLYTSDHGESLGEHGLFDKQTSYEGSVAVPLLIRGPGIAPGQRIDAPLGHVDLHPTLLEMGRAVPEAKPRPGVSVLPRIQGAEATDDDQAFAEYHGGFFQRDWYMLARGNLKYTWYAGDRPSLFDLRQDQQEENDLAQDSSKTGLLADLEQELRRFVNPEQTGLRAKRECGLIGPNGEDYTETLTWPQLKAGRKSGRFKPPFRSKP